MVYRFEAKVTIWLEEDIVEVSKALQIPVNDGDVRAQAHRNLRGLMAHHAAAYNRHVGGRHPRDSAQQNPASAQGSFQILRAHLYSHASRHLAHGRQQRKVVIALANGFVSHGADPGFEKLRSQFGKGRQVQVGEKDQIGTQQSIFGRLGLLYLHDEIG